MASTSQKTQVTDWIKKESNNLMHLRNFSNPKINSQAKKQYWIKNSILCTRALKASRGSSFTLKEKLQTKTDKAKKVTTC